jgi:hypothetical protein
MRNLSTPEKALNAPFRDRARQETRNPTSNDWTQHDPRPRAKFHRHIAKNTLNEQFTQSLKSSERLRSDGTDDQSEEIWRRSHIEVKNKGNVETIEDEFEVDKVDVVNVVDELGNEKGETKHEHWIKNDSVLDRLILSKYLLQIIDQIEYNHHIVNRLKIIF